MPTDTACLVITTTGSEAEAEALAGAVVQVRLAACVQIECVRSVYVWQGEIHREPEWRLLMKTRTDRYAALEAFIRAHHSYEVPEIVQVPVSAGLADYLRWIGEATE